MLLRIDMRSETPIYAQIADSIRAQIETGALEPGAQLPSARSLAVSLDINMHTVLHAYSQLQDQGLVEMRRGRGGVVVVGRAGLGPQVDRVISEARRVGMSRDGLLDLVKERWS
jgi:GntR family transcriptional regulator